MTEDTAITYVEAANLHESATNPRRHFDERGLEELAASIREQGIINPLLVRPAVDDGGKQMMERGPKGDRKPRPAYEVICGARRLRAARAAGMETIPVVVRGLNDSQALETQVVENLQREGVHPLDEAHGFRALMESCRYDVAAVAAKVGRSQSYIYQRLKLADLIEPAQKALWEENITAAHAILIARLQPKEQAEALRQATHMDYAGGRISAAQLGWWIRNNILLDLHAAPFAKADAADLIPSAALCKDCKKRTGYAPALWPELAKHDLCTDRACYAAKTAAHIDRALAAAKAKREPLLRVDNHYGSPREKGAIASNDYRDLGPGEKHCGHARKAIMIAASDKPGQIFTVCPRSSKCKQHWGSYSSARSPSEIAAEKQRKAAARAASRAGQLVLEAIMERVRADPFSAPAMRMLYAAQAGRLDHNMAKRMCEQLGLKPLKNSWGGLDHRVAIAARLDKAPADEVARAAVELALQLELRHSIDMHQHNSRHEHLRDQGKAWGVDVAGIERQVAAEEKERAQAAEARQKHVKKATPAVAAAAKAKVSKKRAKTKGKVRGK